MYNLICTLIVIAISVTVSTIVNVVIMRKVSEMAATELNKVIKNLLDTIYDLISDDDITK